MVGKRNGQKETAGNPVIYVFFKETEQGVDTRILDKIANEFCSTVYTCANCNIEHKQNITSAYIGERGCRIPHFIDVNIK